jgi:hypothetical protein
MLEDQADRIAVSVPLTDTVQVSFPRVVVPPLFTITSSHSFSPKLFFAHPLPTRCEKLLTRPRTRDTFLPHRARAVCVYHFWVAIVLFDIAWNHNRLV